MKVVLHVKQWTTRTNSANRYLISRNEQVEFSSSVGLLQLASPANGQMFVIAEGMGGLSNDRLASEVAIRLFYQLHQSDLHPWSEEELRIFMLTAHRKIREQIAKERLPLMGCSVLIAWLKQDQLIWCGIGKSSLGLYRNEKYTLLNRPHSFAEFAYRDGFSTPERGERLAQAWFYGSKLRDQAANIRIDKGLDTGSLWVQPKDRLVLSSSGLMNQLPPGEIEAALQLDDPIEHLHQFHSLFLKDTIAITLQFSDLNLSDSPADD